MPDFKIIGNQNPVVGITETYSIDFSSLPNIPSFQISSHDDFKTTFKNQVKWTVHVLEYGRWRQTKENEKHGNPITYTFCQRSLTRTLRIKAEINGLSARIDIKAQNAECSKILAIDLLDSEGNKPIKQFAYGEWFIARVHGIHMDNRRIFVTLWEDDSKGPGHNKANTFIKSETGIVKEGIADIKFFLDPSNVWLANARLAPGDQSEGKNHEYYVTAEFFFNGSPHNFASNNTNVPNPDYKPESLKQTPAEQKGISKKDTKGINKAENKAFDYHEAKVSVKPVIEFNPLIERYNKMLKVNVDDNWWEKKEENCVCKEYDLIWGNKVSCEFRKKVAEISKILWPDKYKSMANGLMAVMRVETSETFSPSKIDLVSYVDGNGKKRKKYVGLSKEAIDKLDDNFSGAVGLIQFTKDTIEALNKENSLSLTKKKLALMSDIDQLDYVKKYFMLYDWHKKLLSPEDIYLQVFAPIGIAKEEDYVLYKQYENPQTDKEKVNTKNYNANKSIDEENNNDKKIQRSEILGRYRTSFAEGLSKKEKEFSCGASKEKEESSDIGVLEEMKILVDKHITYSQLGVRNSLSEKGLKDLDCSETVSIYLTKLGITTSVKEIHTGIMTNEKDFRKAIDSENIDFVSGSDSDDFKPKRGDIFVWRRSDGIGHTGIVYEFNEKTDLVTILEAIGKVGSADENTNIKNGGYSGKGSSRTAIYKRSGKALASHKGWKGYFRPKNYTKKL